MEFRRVLFRSTVNTAPAQQVDTTGAGRLITQAMDHSELMANLRHLSDAIGPRLSGSPAMRRANDWGAERFRSYGLTASLEAFPFGVMIGRAARGDRGCQYW